MADTVVIFRPRSPVEVIRKSIVHSLVADFEAAQAARSRLLQLRAQRDALAAETVDRYCQKTARDIHFAEENLADWDKTNGAEYERLGGEVDA